MGTGGSCRTRTAKEDGGVGKLDFPLLADLSKDISRKFNVLVENPEDEHYGVTMRGTFIIDPQVPATRIELQQNLEYSRCWVVAWRLASLTALCALDLLSGNATRSARS